MSVLSGLVLSSYRNCSDTFCIALTTVFLLFFSSSPATAHGNPHDNPYPEWKNTSSQTYCSIYSSYVEENKIIAHVGFNYWKQPYNLFPLQLQAYFPEIIDYNKPTKMKILIKQIKQLSRRLQQKLHPRVQLHLQSGVLILRTCVPQVYPVLFKAKYLVYQAVKALGI